MANYNQTYGLSAHAARNYTSKVTKKEHKPMLPKDLLQYLEKGDRTMEMLEKKPATENVRTAGDMMAIYHQMLRGSNMVIPR